MRNGNVLEEKDAEFTSLSTTWGDEGWALPGGMYRLPTNPRVFKSIADWQRHRKDNESHVSVMQGYSEATILVREGDIRPVPLSHEQWIHVLDAFKMLGTWDAITDKKAEQSSDKAAYNDISNHTMLVWGILNGAALFVAGIMWFVNQRGSLW